MDSNKENPYYYSNRYLKCENTAISDVVDEFVENHRRRGSLVH